jgi:hypothetical protein
MLRAIEASLNGQERDEILLDLFVVASAAEAHSLSAPFRTGRWLSEEEEISEQVRPFAPPNDALDFRRMGRR